MARESNRNTGMVPDGKKCMKDWIIQTVFLKKMASFSSTNANYFFLKPLYKYKLFEMSPNPPHRFKNICTFASKLVASSMPMGIFLIFVAAGVYEYFHSKALILATCKLCAGPRNCMQPLTNSSMSTVPLASTSNRFSCLKSHVQFGMDER